MGFIFNSIFVIKIGPVKNLNVCVVFGGHAVVEFSFSKKVFSATLPAPPLVPVTRAVEVSKGGPKPRCRGNQPGVNPQEIRRAWARPRQMQAHCWIAAGVDLPSVSPDQTWAGAGVTLCFTQKYTDKPDQAETGTGTRPRFQEAPVQNRNFGVCFGVGP